MANSFRARALPRDTRKYQKSCAARAALSVTAVRTTAMETPSESVAISAGRVSCGTSARSAGTAKPNLDERLNIVRLEACRLPPCRSQRIVSPGTWAKLLGNQGESVKYG